MNAPRTADMWDAAQKRVAEAREAIAAADLDGVERPAWATDLLDVKVDVTDDPRPTVSELADARAFLANPGPAPSGDGATDAWEAAERDARHALKVAADLGVRGDDTAPWVPTCLIDAIAEPEPQPSAPAQTLVLRETGEVFDLSQPAGCAQALAAIQHLTGVLHDARNVVVGELVEMRRQMGTSTFATTAGKVTLTSGEERVVDVEKLREGLVEAGAPEALIDEIIVPTVTHKVDLRRADRAASNNAGYAHALTEATTFRPTRVSAKLDAKAATT